MTKMTPKQERFCHEYLIDMNGTQAAIRAGYSKKGADVRASMLLANVKIQQYLQNMQDNRAFRTNIKADRVIEEIARVALANLSDVLVTENIYRDVIDKFGNVTKELIGTRTRLAVDSTDDLPPEIRAAIQSMKHNGKDGSFEVKMHPKTQALEQLAKHLGLYAPEKHQYELTGPAPVFQLIPATAEPGQFDNPDEVGVDTEHDQDGDADNAE